MDPIELLSFSSAYAASAVSVYDLTQVVFVKDKQELSSAKDSAKELSSLGEINDEAIISDAAIALSAKDKSDAPKNDPDKDTTKSEDRPTQIKKELTPEEEQEVAKLKSRDAEVKAHEQAHISAAAGINASAPTYNYQTGPDGEKYAVEGEVNISFAGGTDPEENIANAEAMKAAALAPAQPSGQDLAVARKAEQMIEDAKQQLAEEKSEEISTENKSSESEKTEVSDKADNDLNIKTDKQPVDEAPLKLGD